MPKAKIEKPATKKLIAAIIEECSSKHALHPFETDLNLDFHVELTLSIHEIRQFMIENGNCWDAEKYINDNF